jgi:hypothetical protein
MRARCRYPNHPRFAGWGGRGISVDPRWDDFRQFLRDMGERPEGTSLDRIDEGFGMAEHVILISPAGRSDRHDAQLAGSDQFLVEGTATPLRDCAVALLAGGLADPSDTIVLRFAGSDRDLLRCGLGFAVELTEDAA